MEYMELAQLRIARPSDYLGPRYEFGQLLVNSSHSLEQNPCQFACANLVGPLRRAFLTPSCHNDYRLVDRSFPIL